VGKNPANDNGLLRAIKVCSTPSFRGEVKPSARCHEILWHVKKKPQSMKEIFHKAKFSISFATASRIAREVWWKNKEFSPASIIPPWFSMLIYHLGNEQQAH
jgi:predicted nucleic acid-binding Zn ribbon protein